MLRLPNEVLLIILQNLYQVTDNAYPNWYSKNDLLSTRAVCQRLADIGAYVAFRHMTLKHQLESYQKVLAFSRSKHSDKVKNLTYSFESFESGCIAKDELPAYIRRYTPWVEDYFSDDELDEFQKNYCDRHSEMYFLESTNLDMAHLSAILPRFTNLRSVCISQCMNNLPWVRLKWEAYEDYSPLLELSSGPRIFDNLTAAVRTANLNLAALTLRSYASDIDDIYELPLMGAIQCLSSTRYLHYQSAFQHLNTLSVALPEGVEQGRLNFEGLLVLINSASSVEKLELSMFQQITEIPSDFLENLRVPSLRDISFRNINFSSVSDLTEFISERSGILRRIELCDLTVNEGSWEDAISQMRENLTFDYSNMTGRFCIDGDWDHVEIDTDARSHGKRVLPPRAIESFIERRSDVNPFELVRTNRKKYPLHPSRSDKEMCHAGFCPYHYTLKEADDQLRIDLQAHFVNIAVSMDPWPSEKISLFKALLERQGRSDEDIKAELEFTYRLAYGSEHW